MSFDTRDRKLTRLRRVNPDLANKAEAGDISVNAASVIGGVLKKKPRTSLEMLCRAWRTCTPAERTQFYEFVAQLGLDWPAKVADLELRLAACHSLTEHLKHELEAAEQRIAQLERVAAAWQPEKR